MSTFTINHTLNGDTPTSVNLTDYSRPWQKQWAAGFKHARDLLVYLQLENHPHLLPWHEPRKGFPVRVPLSFAQRMIKGDPNDPLLLQVLSLNIELDSTPGFGTDPTADQDAIKVPGLLHKYPGRILLMTTGACAIHCRYCFRRHFPYGDNHISGEQWLKIRAYLQQNLSIEEVILSGGDPLSIHTPRLKSLLTDLASLPQIKRLRIHTRLPIVLPARVDDELLTLFSESYPWQTIMVLHSNHAQELSDEVAVATGKLANLKNFSLFNQSVLLKNINDNVAVLGLLSQRLFSLGVLPYYLHVLDPVVGAAHFAVEDQQAIRLHRQLQKMLPGYLVPRLVRETPGELSKIWLG